LYGSAAGRRRGTRQVISQCAANLKALEHSGVATAESATHPLQRRIGRTRTLAYTGSEHGAHQPGNNRDMRCMMRFVCNVPWF
jgi:hypothetical protein